MIVLKSPDEVLSFEVAVRYAVAEQCRDASAPLSLLFRTRLSFAPVQCISNCPITGECRR